MNRFRKNQGRGFFNWDAIFNTSISKDYSSQTHVDREIHMSRVGERLRKNGKILLLSGASKIGKTRLIASLVGDRKAIWIPGNRLETIRGFWLRIADSFDLLDTYNKDYEQAILLLERQISATHPYVIIDDFHYAKSSIRQEICPEIRHLSNIGSHVAVIGVTSPPIADIRENHDLRGRIEHIELDPWNEKDLERILIKGIQRDIGDLRGIGGLIAECFGSPFLMTELCLAYCKKYLAEYDPRVEYIFENITYEQVKDICRIIANTSVDNRNLYNFLVNSCLSNQIFIRHDGKKGNLNQIFLYALAGRKSKDEMPRQDLSIPHFVHNIQRVLEQEEDITHILRDNIQYMVDKYLEYYYSVQHTMPHDPIIELIGNKFYLRDPFFLFYLRHADKVEETFWD